MELSIEKFQLPARPTTPYVRATDRQTDMSRPSPDQHNKKQVVNNYTVDSNKRAQDTGAQ